MPKTPTKPKIDTKAGDQFGRRTFCRDGHRIQWPEQRDASRNSWGGTSYMHGGLCSNGDKWSMHRVGHGASAGWRLEHEGQLGWSNAGKFEVSRRDWYARVAHEVGLEIEVNFNCSHAHHRGPPTIIGREEARRSRLAGYPPEIRALAEPSAELSVMADRMQEAINRLTAQGWDFVTDDRIRCPTCIQEEAELDAKLAELRRLDAGEPDAGHGQEGYEAESMGGPGVRVPAEPERCPSCGLPKAAHTESVVDMGLVSFGTAERTCAGWPGTNEQDEADPADMDAADRL